MGLTHSHTHTYTHTHTHTERHTHAQTHITAWRISSQPPHCSDPDKSKASSLVDMEVLNKIFFYLVPMSLSLVSAAPACPSDLGLLLSLINTSASVWVCFLLHLSSHTIAWLCGYYDGLPRLCFIQKEIPNKIQTMLTWPIVHRWGNNFYANVHFGY